MGQFGRITSISDLPSKRALEKLLKGAIIRNEVAAKAPRAPRKASKPEAKPPADLVAALKANPRARATFEGFSPTKRRDYVEWIREAKRAGTREGRIATAILWMAEGKSRNWKYERCRHSPNRFFPAESG